MKVLGERIRELREALDISLREFAKQIKSSPSFVSDVELGRRYPSDKMLTVMAAKLGAPFEKLKALDPRPPMQELKRRAESQPAYGFALRGVVESGVTAEELLSLIRSKSDEGRDSSEDD